MRPWTNPENLEIEGAHEQITAALQSGELCNLADATLRLALAGLEALAREPGLLSERRDYERTVARLNARQLVAAVELRAALDMLNSREDVA